MGTAADANWRLLDTLAQALTDPAANGFEVHYQPIVRLADCVPVAVEALARWRHPIAGPIDPRVFITLAERAGIIAALDDFVLESACSDLGVLPEHLGAPVDVHVNVSALRLGQLSLEAAVARASERLQPKPGQLILEITETSSIENLPRAAAAIRRMQQRGVRFALDDFGAGFNTLVQLHALPVDCIKFAAALMNIEGHPSRGEALCRSLLTIGHDLGATVVAEGIESPQQAGMLRRLGCPMGQGHLFGSAQPLGKLRPSRPL